MQAPSGTLEWLETNRFGSFALGCVDRRLRRKYHALLTVREPGRGDPWNVLAEVHEYVRQEGNSELLCDCLYGELQPSTLASFSAAPFPAHTYRTQGGLEIQRTVRLSPDHDQVELTYRVRNVQRPLELALAPILRCRPIHALTRENPFLDGSLSDEGSEVHISPYEGMPTVAFAVHGAVFTREERGAWHPNVHYPWEEERGYPAQEDVFCPGAFVIKLVRDSEFTFVVGLEHCVAPSPLTRSTLTFAQRLERAAEQFFITTKRGEHAVTAGYPWFGPYARDTLIALPGLHLATGNFERTAAVLEGLLASRINGLIPSIPRIGDGPSVASPSVDASLLFARVIQWLQHHEGEAKVERFMPAVCEMLEALADAHDPRMRLDDGVGVWMQRGPWAFTWMDATVDGQPVTPRHGYAVEVDALAYNAVQFALEWANRQRPLFARAFKPRLRNAETRFLGRYWDAQRGYLADTHDGRVADVALRPNQLWALALPYKLVNTSIARACLEAITRELFTPAGLRTLAPSDPRYHGTYGGNQAARDAAYHQGTVFPWLLGIYAEAMLAIHGPSATSALLQPAFDFLTQRLERDGCVSQVSEVFSGDAPHEAGGAPAQAFSVAEVYRAHRLLEAAAQAARSTGKKTATVQKDMAEKR